MEILFRQYFTDGLYPDSTALKAAAAEAGLDIAAATAYFEDEDNWALIRSADRKYKQGGIDAVPYFMVNGAGVFAVSYLSVLCALFVPNLHQVNHNSGLQGARPPEQLVQAFEEAYTDSSDDDDA